MTHRNRHEKSTTQLDPSVVERRDPAAVVLADQIARLGGTLILDGRDVIARDVPVENAAAAQALTDAYVASLCACGEPATVLVPAGDDLEGVEFDCWDCAETVVTL